MKKECDFQNNDLELVEELPEELLIEEESLCEGEKDVDVEDDDIEYNKEELLGIMFMYHNGTDEDKKVAKEEIWGRIEKYVYNLMHKRFGTYIKYKDDLIQCGTLAVFENMDKFDPEKGKMTTYFKVFILHAMREFINVNVNKISAHYSTKSKPILSAIARYEALGVKYTPVDISMETGIKLETVTKTLRIQTNAQEVYYNNEEYLDSQVTERAYSPEEILLQNEKLKAIYDAISNLSDIEKRIVTMKYGLCGEEKHSTKALSAKTGIPSDKIRKYLNSSTAKLKCHKGLRQLFRDYAQDDEVLLQEEIPSIVPSGAGMIMMNNIEDAEILEYM